MEKRGIASKQFLVFPRIFSSIFLSQQLRLFDLQRLDLSELSDCRIWYAQYAAFPSREDAFAIWQYSSSGRIDGINGNVDYNISFVDYGNLPEEGQE